jgi:hypothetical protein
MIKERVLKGVAAFAVCLFGISSAHANSIPTRSNSSYGQIGNGMTTPYTAVLGLGPLSGATFVLDPTPPGGFNIEVLCGASNFSCSPGGTSYGWVLETTAPLAPGSVITVNFGNDFTSNDPSIGALPTFFMTCDPVNKVVPLFCMQPNTVPSGQCLSEYSVSASGSEPSVFSISLPTDAACIPSTLVFTSDQFVNPGESPTFGTLTVSSPEPSTFLLAIAGLIGLPFIRRRMSH